MDSWRQIWPGLQLIPFHGSTYSRSWKPSPLATIQISPSLSWPSHRLQPQISLLPDSDLIDPQCSQICYSPSQSAFPSPCLPSFFPIIWLACIHSLQIQLSYYISSLSGHPSPSCSHTSISLFLQLHLTPHF